jgi:hypothetical protein
MKHSGDHAMTRTFRSTHLLALIAALFISTAAFSTAMTVPVDQAGISTATLA